MITIEPLEQKYLEGAVVLNQQTFPINYVDPRESIEASLDAEKLEKFQKKLVEELDEPRTRKFQYWVAVEKETDKVVGTTGIYERVCDSLDLCWLAWYCVDPEYRGRGIGALLLGFTLDWARCKGMKKMMLYTSTDPAEHRAHEMYIRRGFVINEDRERIPEGDYEIFFMECIL